MRTGVGMAELVILLIPFAGTSVGAAMVFFMKEKMNAGLERLLLGFASGIMIAASVWSLLTPALEMAQQQGRNPCFTAALGILLGAGFLPGLDRAAACLQAGSGRAKNRAGLDRNAMLLLAVTVHNLPEGMAVGVALAGAMTENAGMTMTGALALAAGIAVQNFPEGSIISMPLRNAGASRLRAFRYGVLSGAVEPAGAVLTILLAEQAVRALPLLLAFAAGAMIYVAADELIPRAGEGGGHSGAAGVILGFVLMMVLDVAAG